MIRKYLLYFLFMHCMIEAFPAQMPKGIKNILAYSKLLVEQPTFSNTHLSAKIDSLSQTAFSNEKLFRTIYEIGITLCNTNQKEEATKYFAYCLPILKEAFDEIPKTSLSTYIHIMNQQGISYNDIGLTDLAMNCYTKALDVADKHNLKEEAAILYNNIASILQAQKKYYEADSLFRKASIINEEGKIPQRLFVNYNNLSVNFAKRLDYNKALEYAFLAIHQLDAAQDSDMIILMHRNIGSIYLKQKETGLALQLLKQVESYQEKNHQEPYLTGTYLIMNTVYRALGQKEKTESYLMKALALAQKYNNTNEKIAILSELSNYYTETGSYKTALDMLQQSTILKDSLHKYDEEKRTKSLSIAYNEERALQEKLIQTENNHTTTLYHIQIKITCCILILITIGVMIILWLKKKKRHIKKLLYKYAREKRSQMEWQEEKLMSLLNKQEQMRSELEVNERERVYLSLQDNKNKEFISLLTERLKHLLLNLNPKEVVVKKQIRDILLQINFIENSNVLQEFRDSFEGSHRHFYEKLGKQYPNLTMKELRLCTLVLLGLSTKEIAGITFKEVRSIESARNRLRKKLQIPQSEDLQKFLVKFKDPDAFSEE